MINITDEYLEDEIRDGFYIPSMTKRTFAMELTVLDLIDTICKKHNITYFADYGTYLGAVRHGGFIPWDDDLDICMHRNEFERFCEAAKTELPDGYSIITYKNNDYSWKFIANVTPNNHMCFEPDYLKANYAFPYMVGVDIFIIDNINDNSEIEAENSEKIKKILNTADTIDSYELSDTELNTPIDKLENSKINNIVIYIINELNIEVVRKNTPQNLKRILYSEVENLLKASNNQPTKKVIQKIPWGIYHNMSFPSEYFKDSINVPFEMTTISVPKCYDRGMRIKFGNYMKIIMGVGGHDYPYYIGQKKSLNTDFEYPTLYKFNESDLKPVVKNYDGSLKSIAKDMTGYFSESLNVITGIIASIKTNNCRYSIEDISGFLADVQDNVIQFGTLIEKVKGEGTNIVSLLEKYCEYLFILSNNIFGDVDNTVSDFVNHTDSIISEIESEIINRRTVLFLPFKAKYWSSLEPVFNMECRGAKPNNGSEQNGDSAITCDLSEGNACGTDVIVTTLPYYYKEYNGAFKEPEQNEVDKITDLISKCPMEAAEGVNVYIKDYSEIDLALLCPEVIYINNPYDEYNMAISVPQYFYARNLRQYTEKLIYIPFFKSMEFEKSNYPCFYNMQYYCTVPGVVLADEVWLQSENIRDRYIDKLEEWCKKDLRLPSQIRNNGKCEKISSDNSSVQNNNCKIEHGTDLIESFDSKFKIITDIIPNYFDRVPSVPEGIKAYVEEAKQNGNKLLVWYINAGTLLEYKNNYLDKMKRCLDTYIDSRDQVKILLIYDDIINSPVLNDDAKLYEQIIEFTEDFKKENVGIIVNEYVDFAELNNMPDYADAYYGNPSIICKDFELAKKPVMIQNVEI